MVVRAKLIQLLFRLPYIYAVGIVGGLDDGVRDVRRHARHDVGADH
jgi:hypothetical protein